MVAEATAIQDYQREDILSSLTGILNFSYTVRDTYNYQLLIFRGQI